MNRDLNIAIDDVFNGVDLFCGAGGITNALIEVLLEIGYTHEQIGLMCINHWDVAIATHKINHPYAKHLCTGVQNVDPWSVVEERHLDILVAGPQCTYFSKARGGRPVTDQQRISPWMVIDWLEKIDVSNFLIENVPELVNWGPVDPKTERPVASKKGNTFRAYIKALRSLGYMVDYRVLCCADYGDATTRERLFILGRKGKRIYWPVPTHVSAKKVPQKQLISDSRKAWRPAREIIDWDTPGSSIFKRKKPLSPNTLRRIEAGLRRFCGLEFVLGQQSGSVPRSIDEPIPTIATDGAISLVQPFILKFYNNGHTSDIDEPLPTITARGQHLGLIQPFIMNMRGNDGYSRGSTVEEPLPTITAHPPLALVDPFLVPYYSESEGQKPRVHSIDEPVPTIVGENRFGLAQPFVIAIDHTKSLGIQVHDIEEPLRTITTENRFALVQPFLTTVTHGEGDERAYSVDEPLRTVTNKNGHALVQAFLVQYNSNPLVKSVDEPLGTQTTKDRFGLAQPIFIVVGDEVYMLDILFRMLMPKELAAASSFPEKYVFTGNKEQVVKQIGNAVPKQTAKALIHSLLRDKGLKREGSCLYQ